MTAFQTSIIDPYGGSPGLVIQEVLAFIESSLAVESAPIGMGVVVSRGADQQRQVVAGGDYFTGVLGISCRVADQAGAAGSEATNLVVRLQNSPCPAIRTGYVWARCTGSGNAGSRNISFNNTTGVIVLGTAAPGETQLDPASVELILSVGLGEEMCLLKLSDIRVKENAMDFFQQVAEGLVPGYSTMEKFGENPEVTTANDPEDVWDGGGIYNYSSTADIDRLSSSDASDVCAITVIGLDGDGNEVTQVITLTGQTPVALTTPLRRVYRMINFCPVDLAGDCYCFVSGGSVVAGVPQVAADIRAIIRDGNNQTLMCIYTIPAGKTGYFWGGYVAVSRGVPTSAAADFTWRYRILGGPPNGNVASRISCLSGGGSHWDYTYKLPVVLPGLTDVWIRCEEVSATLGVSGGFTVLLKDNL